MGLLQKLKSTLGLGGSRSQGGSERGGDVDVTVEHEPDATAEAAVKGSDDSQVGETAGEASVGEAESPVEEAESPVEEAKSPAEEAEPSSGDETGDASEADDSGADDAEVSGEGVPVEDLDGIGAAYAERLGNAGVETVADLAGADAASVAAESDVAESRIERWIEQAREY